MIRVLKLSGEELTAAAGDDVKNAAELKEHLLSLFDLPVCIQQLVQGGRVLTGEAGLSTPSEVFLVLVPASSTVLEVAFSSACDKGNAEAVRLLAGANANVDRGEWKDKKYHTALTDACENAMLSLYVCFWKSVLARTWRKLSSVHLAMVMWRQPACFWLPAPIHIGRATIPLPSCVHA